ncbi:MAG: hypothetical protein ISR96_00785 [Nitrospira sp.]|nr:hypothetical protein [Nitrospira sp.]
MAIDGLKNSVNIPPVIKEQKTVLNSDRKKKDQTGKKKKKPEEPFKKKEGLIDIRV